MRASGSAPVPHQAKGGLLAGGTDQQAVADLFAKPGHIAERRQVDQVQRHISIIKGTQQGLERHPGDRGRCHRCALAGRLRGLYRQSTMIDRNRQLGRQGEGNRRGDLLAVLKGEIELPHIGRTGRQTGRQAVAAQTLAIVDKLGMELRGEQGRPVRARLDSNLDRDLGFDSLSRAELILRLDRAFRVRLPDWLINDAEPLVSAEPIG